ncbi:MAG: LptF/LptG family permease [bacterium]|nr:LptF/LptG family permease [bacterium]
MKTIDRYLVREFLVPCGYCLAAFLLVYIIYDLSAHLDEYISHQIPLRLLGNYYLVQMPLVLVNIIPLSILLAIVYCLGMLARHNEITAMRASGISIYRIMLPFIGLGVCFTLLLAWLNENFAPEAYARSERLIEEYGRRAGREALQPLAFFNPIEQRTWSAQWVPGGDSLYDVSVRSLMSRQVTDKVSAKKASYLDGEWWFFDGSIQYYDGRGRLRSREEPFTKRRLPFKEKPDDFVSSQKDSISMSSRELSRNMAFYPPDSEIYRRKLVDLRHKTARPFVGLTIVLIAVPLAMRASRGGAAGSAGLSIALGISYYVVEVIGLSMGRGGMVPPCAGAWLPNVLFGAIGIALIARIR